MALFGFLRRKRASPVPPVAPDKLEALEGILAQIRRELDELKGSEALRELQHRELTDKVLRYMKRIQEVERRAEERANGQSGGSRAALAARILDLKFPKGVPTQGEG
jgi:hypothetical protein